MAKRRHKSTDGFRVFYSDGTTYDVQCGHPDDARAAGEKYTRKYGRITKVKALRSDGSAS